jgi:hypothetical protein
MFRFSYEINGLKIRVAIKDRKTFLIRLDELCRLVTVGKATNVTFYEGGSND